jgi:drug/metabolite transporter (DMT)-like permease
MFQELLIPYSRAAPATPRLAAYFSVQNPTASPQPAVAPPQSHARGVALMLVSASLFATSVLLIRAVGRTEAVNVWLISAVRFVVGLGLCFTVYHGEFQPVRMFRQRLLIERGLLGGASVCAYYVALLRIGAGRATFINSTYLIWGGLFAVWALRERFRWPLGVGAVAALGGLGLLTNTFASAGATPGWFDLLALGTALASGWIVVTIRKLHATEHTATIFGSQCAYGLVVCALPALWNLQPLSATALLLLVSAGLLAGFGQLAMTSAYRSLTVAEGSLIQMVVPIGIAAGGMAFFAERFRPSEMLGAGLILAGTALPLVHRRQTAPPAAQPLRAAEASPVSSG